MAAKKRTVQRDQRKVDLTAPAGSREWQNFQQMMGPSAGDHAVRNAIRTCWMALPPERKSVNEVEKEVHRLVDRAFRDMREDEQQMRAH